MSARQARFQIVRSEAGWFGRFRAANGRKVWQTESYTRRAYAEDALFLLADFFGGGPFAFETVDERPGADA